MARTESIFDTPAYGAVQAAHYVGVPPATLRRWAAEDGLIKAPGANHFSFNNVAEAHVLKAMRKVHKLSLQSIRRALRELQSLRATQHPLLEESFETDGVSLCIREEERIINLSRNSQQEIRDFVALYLHRIGRDAAGRAARLYPFVVREDAGEPKSISISPEVAFGRPVLAGTGISTAVIYGRFSARDSIGELAREYQVSEGVLEDAIRWESLKGRAA